VIEVLTGKLVNRSIPHISLHHVTRFEPITAAHFDQRYNNIIYGPTTQFVWLEAKAQTQADSIGTVKLARPHWDSTYWPRKPIFFNLSWHTQFSLFTAPFLPSFQH